MIYYNLTQCANDCNGNRVVYFRSTDIEQRNYERLLWSVPDEWLYLLYQGIPIHVVDKSTHERGKIERIFIPVLNDVLNWIWFDKCKPQNLNLKEHLWEAEKTLNDIGGLRQKFGFWRKKVRDKINITCSTTRVDREDNPI